MGQPQREMLWKEQHPASTCPQESDSGDCGATGSMCLKERQGEARRQGPPKQWATIGKARLTSPQEDGSGVCNNSQVPELPAVSSGLQHPRPEARGRAADQPQAHSGGRETALPPHPTGGGVDTAKNLHAGHRLPHGQPGHWHVWASSHTWPCPGALGLAPRPPARLQARDGERRSSTSLCQPPPATPPRRTSVRPTATHPPSGHPPDQALPCVGNPLSPLFREEVASFQLKGREQEGG